jgi:hypothetical protein
MLVPIFKNTEKCIIMQIHIYNIKVLNKSNFLQLT